MSASRPEPEIQEDKLPPPQSPFITNDSPSQQTCDQLPPPEPERVPPLHLTEEAHSSTAVPAPHIPPPTVPGYEILSELGHGGMGVVYQARQVSLGRVVALKMIRSVELAGRDDLLRFKRAAVMVSQLKHHNNVPNYEDGENVG